MRAQRVLEDRRRGGGPPSWSEERDQDMALQLRNPLATRARLHWSVERVVYLLEASVAQVGAGLARCGGVHPWRARQPNHRRVRRASTLREGNVVAKGETMDAAIALLHDDLAGRAGIAPRRQLEHFRLLETWRADEINPDMTLGGAGLPADAQDRDILRRLDVRNAAQGGKEPRVQPVHRHLEVGLGRLIATCVGIGGDERIL